MTRPGAGGRSLSHGGARACGVSAPECAAISGGAGHARVACAASRARTVGVRECVRRVGAVAAGFQRLGLDGGDGFVALQQPCAEARARRGAGNVHGNGRRNQRRLQQLFVRHRRLVHCRRRLGHGRRRRRSGGRFFAAFRSEHPPNDACALIAARARFVDGHGGHDEAAQAQRRGLRQRLAVWAKHPAANRLCVSRARTPKPAQPPPGGLQRSAARPAAPASSARRAHSAPPAARSERRRTAALPRDHAWQASCPAGGPRTAATHAPRPLRA